MALWEGSVIAAVIALFGVAPKRVMPPHLFVVPILPMPVHDASHDVSTDVSADVSDTSSGQTGPETSTAPSKTASPRAFVKWWRALDEARKQLQDGHRCRGVVLPSEVTQRVLLGLYAEFCEGENLIPLSDRQLLNKIKSHGVRVRRPPAKLVDGKLRRPSMYSLAPRRG